MATSPLAGKPAPKELLVDLDRLEREYYQRTPDPADPAQRVAFGTSGHRGSSLRASFNEAHILAITQAICDYRRSQATDGPLYMGKDTHALSGPAQRTALEVLAANGVETVIQRDDGAPLIRQHPLAMSLGGLNATVVAAIRKLQGANYTIVGPISLKKTITAIIIEAKRRECEPGLVYGNNGELEPGFQSGDLPDDGDLPGDDDDGPRINDLDHREFEVEAE